MCDQGAELLMLTHLNLTGYMWLVAGVMDRTDIGLSNDKARKIGVNLSKGGREHISVTNW